MTLEATPRVEVELRVTKICFLSSEPCFNFILLLTLRNSENSVLFLKDGFTGVEGFQSINSDQVIQCFDDDSGEQLQVLRQGTQPSFLQLEPNRGGYVTFTTSSAPRPYELPFDSSSLQTSKKFRLRFKPTNSLTHWPSSREDSLNSLSGVSSSPLTATDIPKPSTTSIAWDVVGGNDTVIFETRDAPSKTPKVTVSLSAHSTFSLSRHPPFIFTLTFSTDALGPITVLADRASVQAKDCDIEILDPTFGSRLGPVLIDDGNDDGSLTREEFLRIDGTYTEQRELDPRSPFWDELGALKIGEEHILRSLGATWSWWTEDTIDEVMTYLGDRSSTGLGRIEAIKYPSAGEQKFTVVE